MRLKDFLTTTNHIYTLMDDSVRISVLNKHGYAISDEKNKTTTYDFQVGTALPQLLAFYVLCPGCVPSFEKASKGIVRHP